MVGIPQANSVEVHPQLSVDRHPMDGALVGAGSPWPTFWGLLVVQVVSFTCNGNNPWWRTCLRCVIQGWGKPITHSGTGHGRIHLRNGGSPHSLLEMETTPVPQYNSIYGTVVLGNKPHDHSSSLPWVYTTALTLVVPRLHILEQCLFQIPGLTYTGTMVKTKNPKKKLFWGVASKQLRQGISTHE